MRVAKACRGRQADFLERPDNAGIALGGADLGEMHRQALADDLVNRQARAQRAEGVLKDDLHV
ncbi:hypothetical protein D3C72_2322800 [compost metagenome]